MIKTVGGALFDKNRLLIAKRTIKRSAWPGLWEIPRGYAEKNEADKEALKREFKEETGLKIRVGKKYFEFKCLYRGKSIKERNYIVLSKISKIKIDPKEHSKFRWVTKAEAETLNMASEMRMSIRKAFEVYNKLL